MPAIGQGGARWEVLHLQYPGGGVQDAHSPSAHLSLGSLSVALGPGELLTVPPTSGCSKHAVHSRRAGVSQNLASHPPKSLGHRHMLTGQAASHARRGRARASLLTGAQDVQDVGEEVVVLRLGHGGPQLSGLQELGDQDAQAVLV